MQIKIGPIGLLTLIFITLKLTGVIAWSWWWVLSPIWITGSVIMVLAILLFTLGGPETK
jgi:hypothetical protein